MIVVEKMLLPDLMEPSKLTFSKDNKLNLDYFVEDKDGLKWLYGQSLIQGIKGGSAQPKFNKTDFKNLPIYLPPDDLLEHFHLSVKPMFELIAENNIENQRLSILRDTLLPKLMSGELDVSDIDL